MTRFLLPMIILSCALLGVALLAEVPESLNSSTLAPANAGPVYVKIIWTVDPATPTVDPATPTVDPATPTVDPATPTVDPATPVIGTDRPVIESWITKSIETQHKGNFRAVTEWVLLVEGPFESTDLWDGKLDGVQLVCESGADVIERKDGWIKIDVGTGIPVQTIVTLRDEPGSREVVATRGGMTHVAVFIGLPVSKSK